jgi:putative tryptophan/tyrosine transport system substrate-binding protein
MATHIRRRELIAALGGLPVVWPLAALAQQASKPPTIGFLGATTPAGGGQLLAAFVQRLRELGWVEGRNVAIEIRWGEGRSERFAEIAAEFVRLKVDVILTHNTPPVLAAKQATSSIPIVFATAGDPVGTGVVASLARPGATSLGCRAGRPMLSASDSNCCARLCRVFVGWRSWPVTVPIPCWT